MAEMLCSDMCRVCLKVNTPNENFVPIFNTYKLDKPVSLLLNDMANINVSLESDMPIMLCDCCMTNLIQCTQFKELVQRTDRYLTNWCASKTCEGPIIDGNHVLIVEDEVKFDIKPDTDNLLENIKYERDGEELPLEVKLEIKDVVKKTPKKRTRIKPKKVEREKAVSEEEESDEKFNCCMCPKVFDNEGDALEHFKNVHENVAAKTLRPNVKTRQRYNFECNMCLATCKTLKLLKRHQRQFLTAKQCQECGVFVPCQKFTEHCLKHLPEDERLKVRKLHECDICHKTLSCKKALRRHIETHGTGMNYKCDECSKELKTESAWRSHLYYHELRRKGKTIKCPACPMSFHRNVALEIHLRTHSGEKPFECQYCDRKYADRSDLRRHIWMHTGESPYRCKKCSKMFIRKDYLRSHESACNAWPNTNDLPSNSNAIM